MKFVGKKFDRSLTTKEIAARVRQEIKEAVKAGDLPKVKFSVRMSTYSGGSSIDIQIQALPFAILNAKRLELEAQDPSYSYQTYNVEPRYSDEARAVLKRVEGLLQNYNYDDSDSMSDSFDVKFYGHVNFSWQEEAAESARMLAAIDSARSAA